ncbi:hypothetical protein [Falsiruegeria mediterranea]|uniref:Uncharacterized protein n=1 Tax=Falsiruegeria mediterranea M17 TaxID=1200281 RepID=A0A2R8CGB5_9RHOB|nr:hypothetical protein [Falsiruegeria mediterranea]SPJ31485.1 hypothetical protein TRM7615_05028 [Falsiruegeria mediterranea M17]
MDWGIDTPTGVRPLAEVAEPLREDLRKHIETNVGDWQRTLKAGDFVVVAELGSPGFASADVKVTYGTVTDG